MRITLRSAAAAAVLAAAAINLSSTAAAHDGPPTGECHFRGAGGYGGLPGPEGMPEHDGHGMGWGHHMAMLGGAPLPPWLHPLHLSEAQQDSVFKLMHEQEPGLREHFKAVHASREALHRSALTAGTDPAQLRTLADASGKADAELAMLMAQTDQQLLQILTPEQKKSLQDCLPKAGS
ncbi:MAG: Spy/CpxP family protein refolding chaperone [Pseudomonadota bacterium]|nr:Spy/CpxP family protein refolding chaperone [Pseudomonadota bacterium]